MRRSSKARIVGVRIGALTLGHLPDKAGSPYLTLCGLDGDDPEVGQYPAPEYTGKVTCRQCLAMWRVCTTFKLKDFDVQEDSIDG